MVDLLERKDLLVGLCAILLLTSFVPAGLAEDDDKPVEEPYVVSMQWDGVVACTATWPTGGLLPYSGANACGVVEIVAPGTTGDDFLHRWTIQEDLQTVVGAMVWESELMPTELQLYMEVDGRSNLEPRYVAEEGASPLQWRVDAGDVEENYPSSVHQYDFNNVEGSLDLMYRVFAGGDLNVVVQQPFTVHWDLYYGEPAPEDASALPE